MWTTAETGMGKGKCDRAQITEDPAGQSWMKQPQKDPFIAIILECLMELKLRKSAGSQKGIELGSGVPSPPPNSPLTYPDFKNSHSPWIFSASLYKKPAYIYYDETILVIIASFQEKKTSDWTMLG